MVALFVVGMVALGIVVGTVAFRRDTEKENRRKAAITLAGKMREYGATHTAEMLTMYAVGDYSGMGQRVVDLVKLFTVGGEGVVLAEFDAAFERVLSAKLATPAGRAELVAKITPPAVVK